MPSSGSFFCPYELLERQKSICCSLKVYNALIITPLFITQAPTCFGIHMPSSGSFLCAYELLERQKLLCCSLKVYNALIITSLFITQAPTCFGIHMPSSGNFLFADGSTWSVAANILNKQSRTTDKRWSSSLGGGGPC
jgi:prepilin-type processing-associated H-X9-DG protein